MCKDKSGPITKINRNKCRKCRLARCIAKGMNKNGALPGVCPLSVGVGIDDNPLWRHKSVLWIRKTEFEQFKRRCHADSTTREGSQKFHQTTPTRSHGAENLPQPNYQNLYPSVPADFVRRSSVYGNLLPIPAHPLTFNLPPYIYQPTPMYQPFRMHCYQLAADELMKNIALMRSVPDMKILPIEDQVCHPRTLQATLDPRKCIQVARSVFADFRKEIGLRRTGLPEITGPFQNRYHWQILQSFKSLGSPYSDHRPRLLSGALLNHIGRTLFCIADDRWRSLEVFAFELNAVTDDMLVELLFSTYTTNSPFHEVLATLYAKPASC
ncbi:hypothetical protein CEXT_723971 [Caerostris extrusa]|uniref:Nuclear receptor domain-containing protein n=1 Tax=Caerostris extrusa TaxID=172846 RepID=A0AAV4XEG0_CAEEX|nr:hypothetical protein CEXT_723971 [Caerostris extrusa]